MNLKTGDIVRFKTKRDLYKGLYEIVDQYENKTYHYSVTGNECDTEIYVNRAEIILVCSVNDRKDI